MGMDRSENKDYQTNLKGLLHNILEKKLHLSLLPLEDRVRSHFSTVLWGQPRALGAISGKPKLGPKYRSGKPTQHNREHA